MNIFRNKYVVIGLAVAALAMLANSLRPMWQRGRPAAPSAPAPAQAAAPAVAPVASNASGSAAARPQVEAAQPARGIDLEQVGWSVDGAPRRDPFQVMGPAPGNLSRLYPSATELLTLRAIWWQSGTILAEVNNRIVREGNTITAAKGDAITEFKILNIGAERIWVEGPGGEEQLPFDPTLSLRGINVKLTEGTNDSFAAAKARLDWPYRIVNGITNDAYADPGWYTLSGTVEQSPSRGRLLVSFRESERPPDVPKGEPVIVKNVPLDFADKELLPAIRCKRVEKESYETPLRVNKTVFAYDFGAPCSPPKNVIDSLKLQKDFIRDQYSQANQRRVKFEMQEAEKGSSSAQYMLGRRYLYGDGVTKDEKEGRRWLQASAVQGNPDAQAKLQSLASQN